MILFIRRTSLSEGDKLEIKFQAAAGYLPNYCQSKRAVKHFQMKSFNFTSKRAIVSIQFLQYKRLAK